MNVEHVAGGTSLIDVLDRVLDKGIVFDHVWAQIPLSVGDAQVVVTSGDTRLRFSEAVGAATAAAHPTVGSHASSESALLQQEDDDDDDDGGGGSSGAPARVYVETEPRRFPPPRPRRTRH